MSSAELLAGHVLVRADEVEKQLWRIFTHYTLYSKTHNPLLLERGSWEKFCRGPSGPTGGISL